jgi:hypothetical protein
MQEILEWFQAFIGETCAKPMGTTLSSLEHGESFCVEGLDDIANRLIVATKLAGDDGGSFSANTGEHHLATTQDKGIRRTQSRLELFLFVFRYGSNEDGRFHAFSHTTFPMTFR